MDKLLERHEDRQKDCSWRVQQYTKDLRQRIMSARDTTSIPVRLLRAVSNNNELRMKMLELVDVLPSLTSADDIHTHFDLIVGKECSKISGWTSKCAEWFSIPLIKSIGAKSLAWITYKKLAPYFIVDPPKLAPMLIKHKNLGMNSNLDFVGEAVVSEKEATDYLDRYLVAIKKYGKKHKNLSVSIKPSSLYAFFSPENYKESKRVVCGRLMQVLREAKKTNTEVTIDAEQNQYSHLIEDIFCTLIDMEEFCEMENIGIALQAYRKNSMESAMMLVEAARKRQTPFFIRLVKGAYWDSELAWAQQKGWEMPLFENKEETDRNFIVVAEYLFANWETVYVSPATHNPESIANMFCLAKNAGAKLTGSRPEEKFRFEALYGLGDPICAVLKDCRCKVMVYMPVGNLKEGMSYMARRILENTSNDGFLIELLK